LITAYTEITCNYKKNYNSLTDLCSLKITTAITNSMELITTEVAASCAAPEELPSIYGTHRFITTIPKAPPLVPILRQTNPVHITPT
jgi:hypothetical protein